MLQQAEKVRVHATRPSAELHDFSIARPDKVQCYREHQNHIEQHLQHVPALGCSSSSASAT